MNYKCKSEERNYSTYKASVSKQTGLKFIVCHCTFTNKSLLRDLMDFLQVLSKHLILKRKIPKKNCSTLCLLE